MAYSVILMKDFSFFATTGFKAGENDTFVFDDVTPLKGEEKGKTIDVADMAFVFCFDGDISCKHCLKNATEIVEAGLKEFKKARGKEETRARA